MNYISIKLFKREREDKILPRFAFSQPLSALRLFHAPALLQGEILSDFASRGHWVRNGVWGWGCVRRAKKTSWISSSHPRTTLPCLAQLGAWRFTTEDFKNISRSVFIAKHVESIAHYEFSVHFILFPGLCPFDPSFQFVSEKQMPCF